jgi:hypothetical protein
MKNSRCDVAWTDPDWWEGDLTLLTGRGGHDAREEDT